MNRQALRLTIAVVRKMMPLILNLLKNVEAAKSESSEGGKKITRNEKWMIAEEASFQIMPALIETIADALE
jgi:hypothetical protein